MKKLLRLLKKNVLAITINQEQDSPFSVDLLTRILYEDLISLERWNEVPVADLKNTFPIKASTIFHKLQAEMQKLRKLSCAGYPDSLEGWRGIEVHLQEARAKQTEQEAQKERADAEGDDDIYDLQVSQVSESQGLIPMGPGSQTPGFERVFERDWSSSHTSDPASINPYSAS